MALRDKLKTENPLLQLPWILFSPPLLRASPCLPQCRTYSLTAGGCGAEGGLWGREVLPSGCGDNLVSAGPGSGRPEGRCSSPQGAAERSAVQPQTQLGQDLLAFGFLLPPGFTQGLRQAVYMQRLSSVPASAHQKEFHSECWRWEEDMMSLQFTELPHSGSRGIYLTPHVSVFCLIGPEPVSWLFYLTLCFIVVILLVMLSVLLLYLYSGEFGDPHTNTLKQSNQETIVLYGPICDQMCSCVSDMKICENHCVCIIFTYEVLMQEWLIIIIYFLYRKKAVSTGKMTWKHNLFPLILTVLI